MPVDPSIQRYLDSKYGSTDLEPTQPESPGFLSKAYSGVLDIAGLQKRLVDKYVSEALGLEQPAEGQLMPTLGQRLGRSLFTPEPEDNALEGVARGVTTFATDVATDPLTYELGFLGKGAAGLAKVLGGTPAVAIKAAQAASAATAGLFVPAMAESAMTNIPAGIKAAREGRAGEAAEKITEGTLAGGAGFLGARHAAKAIWGESTGIAPERVDTPIEENAAVEKPKPLDTEQLAEIAARKKAFKENALRQQAEAQTSPEEPLLMIEPEAEVPPIAAAPEAPVVSPPPVAQTEQPVPPVQPPAIVEGPQIGEQVVHRGVEHTVTSEPYFDPSNGKVMVGAQSNVEGVGEIAIPIEEARPPIEPPTKAAPTPTAKETLAPEAVAPPEGVDLIISRIAETGTKLAKKTRESQESDLFREIPQVDIATLDDTQLQALQKALKPYGSKIAKGIQSEVTNEYLRRGAEGLEMGGGLVPPIPFQHIGRLAESMVRGGYAKAKDAAEAVLSKARSLFAEDPFMTKEEFTKAMAEVRSPLSKDEAIPILYKMGVAEKPTPAKLKTPIRPLPIPKESVEQPILPAEQVAERAGALEAGEAYPTDITRLEKATGMAPKKPKVTVTEAAPITPENVTPRVVSQVIDRARVLGQGKVNPGVIRNAATELGLDTKSSEGLEALRTGVNSLAGTQVVPKNLWKPVEAPIEPKVESKLAYKQLEPVAKAIEVGKPEEQVVKAYEKTIATLKKGEKLESKKEAKQAAEAGEALGEERQPTPDILERISKAPGRIWQGQGTKADNILEIALKRLSPGSRDLFRRSIQLYHAGYKPGEKVEVAQLMDRLSEEMGMSRDAIKKSRERLKKDVERVTAEPMTVGGTLLPIDPLINLVKRVFGIRRKSEAEHAISMPEAEAGFRALDLTKGPIKAKPGVKGEPDVVESWINTDNNLLGVSEEGKRAIIQNSQRLQEAGTLDRTNKGIAKALEEQAKLVGLADHNTLIEKATENLKNVREAPAYLAALKQRLAEAGESEASYKLLSEDLNLPLDKREGAMLAGTATNLQMSQLAYVAANNSSAGGRNLALARWMKTPHPSLSRKNVLKEGLKQAGIHPDQIKDIMQAYDDFLGGDTNYESVQSLIQQSVLKGRDQSIWESAMHLYKHGLLGIPSAIANMSGNVISYFLKTQIESRAAAGLSSAVSAITGKAREYYHPPREIYEGITSEVNRTVLSRVMKDLANVALARPLEQAPGVLDQLYGIADLHRTKNPLPGRLGEFLGNSMYKLLEIGDTATKSKILYHELAKKAWNIVKKANPEGDKATLIKESLSKMNEWTKAFEKGEVSGEVAKIWKEAANNTARAVFQEVGKRGSVSRALERGLGAHPMLDLIVPFKRTPINIFLETARRLPILGFTRFNKLRLDLKAGKISPETFYTEMAKPVVGTLVGYLLYDMAKNKMLTGGGPTDPKQEEALRQTGWAPYSVRLPKELAGKEMYVSFQRLEPLSSVIGIAADVAEAERLGKVKDAKTLTEKLISSLGANLINKTFISGLESLATAWADPKLYLSRFTKQLQGSVIPATIGYVPFAGLARDIDPVFRKTEAFTTEPFKARIPGLSKTLEPQRTATGEERPRREVLGGARSISPFEFTEAKTGPEARLNKEFINTGYIPSLIPDSIKIQGRDADLTPQERQTLTQARKSATQAAMRVIQDPTYQRLPNNPDEALYPGQKTKRDVLEKIYSRYRQIVMRSLRPSLRQRAWKQPPQQPVEVY